ncbi:hypothetical protein MTO96_046419, partial [Rhipicephalus appendiculatus]
MPQRPTPQLRLRPWLHQPPSLLRPYRRPQPVLLLSSLLRPPPRRPLHTQGLARCAVYVKRELLQAEVPVADLVGGPFECCAVRIRLDGEGHRRGQRVHPTLPTLGPQLSSATGKGLPALRRHSHPPQSSTSASPRDREYRVVDWRVYRQLFKQDTGGTDLLQLVADNARAATVVAKVSQGKPAPDIQHLALAAARRRAERQALKRAQPELWTVFRKVDAVCRRHANRRRNQGWVSVCVSIDRSRDGTRAWRLLKCLLMVPRAFNQVLSLAIHLTIQAADLAEQLADQFAARDIAQLPAAPPPAALQCPASCHHPGWIAVQ